MKVFELILLELLAWFTYKIEALDVQRIVLNKILHLFKKKNKKEREYYIYVNVF